MWSNWMNRFVAPATKPDAARIEQRNVRVRDVGDHDLAELDREDLRDEDSDSTSEPGDSTPIRF